MHVLCILFLSDIIHSWQSVLHTIAGRNPCMGNIRNFDVFKHQLAGNFLPFCRFVFYNKVKHFCQGTGMFQKGGADLARYTHHGESFFHGTIQNNIQNREKTGQKQFLGTHCHAKDRCKIFCKLGTQQERRISSLGLSEHSFSMTVV